MQTRRFLITAVLLSILIVGASGCTGPVRHIPAWSPDPVLNLRFPERIETLRECPRTRTIVTDGIATDDGRRFGGDIEEMFDFQKHSASFQERTEYHFTLFTTAAAAEKWYEDEKNWYARDGRVFREVEQHGNKACVLYAQQDRSPEMPIFHPTGGYDSAILFRLRNVIVIASMLQSQSHRSQPQREAIHELAKMLSAAIEAPPRAK